MITKQKRAVFGRLLSYVKHRGKEKLCIVLKLTVKDTILFLWT
nr:MAG TPA: hypothetical protein [Caudoviricetes sp.]